MFHVNPCLKHPMSKVQKSKYYVFFCEKMLHFIKSFIVAQLLK